MKSEVAKAIKTLEYLFPSVLVEHIDCMWGMDGDDVTWNTDNCEEDLANGDGDTYSGTITREGVGADKWHTAMNLDCGMGQDVTMVFDNDKRL